MGHRAVFTESLGVERGIIYRYVSATWKDTKMKVLKQKLGSEDKYIRNINFNYTSGWIFYTPNDKLPYSTEKVGIEKYFKCACNCNIYGASEMTYDEIMELIETTKYKDFNYTLKYLKTKSDKPNSVCDIYYLLENWIEDKSIELLVKADLMKLALDKTFLRLTKENQKAVIKVAKSGKAPESATTKELLIMAKTNCDYDLCIYGGDPKLKDYLLEQNEYLDYYNDYVRMAKKLRKNLKDNYWRYPKSLVEAHNKCAKEMEKVLEIERIIKARKDAEKFAKQNEIINHKIKYIARKTSFLNSNINGFEICVAKDLEDIKTQAEVLDQCLITNSYYEKHANKKCLLVFIKKGNTRLATAEVFYDKEKPLGQFYADERDRSKCKPNEEIKTAFYKWLNQRYLTSKLCVSR